MSPLQSTQKMDVRTSFYETRLLWTTG